MSTVLERPHRKVSDILTNPTSDMEVHDIIIDDLVLLTSVLSVTWTSRHNTILNTVAQ